MARFMQELYKAIYDLQGNFSSLFTKVCLHYLVTWPKFVYKSHDKNLLGDLCLEKAYKAIFDKSLNNTTLVETTPL